MNFRDTGNKIILRQTIDGQERSVGFLEYREHADENRVVTGVIEALPHLDPYEAGVELLTFLRAKYSRPEWSIETEPRWCKAEYLQMIERSIEDGHNFYDVIGESVALGEVTANGGLTEQWEYESLATTSIDSRLPTVTLWPVMEKLDEE